MPDPVISQLFNDYIIVQAAPPRTGSTLLTNILYGMYQPDVAIKHIPSMGKQSLFDKGIKNSYVVVKTHCVKLQRIMDVNQDRKLLFIYCSRPEHGKKLPEQYKSYDNVLNIQYKDIAEKHQPDSNKVIEHVFYKVKQFVGDKIKMPGSDGEVLSKIRERIRGMNKRCEELKDEPFSKWCPFYHIHGSHKNRGKR